MSVEYPKMRVLELFAGVGGFRIGLEKANQFYGNPHYEVVWSNQWDPDLKRQFASEIYVKHWGSAHHVCKDIATVNPEEIPDGDFLVAGFPCQDYSVAKGFKGEGINGKKGVLWWQLAKIIEEKKPSYLLLENVDRLLGSPAKRKGRDFAIMLAKLNDMKYIVEWRVINAADYGHPQKRKRVFIFAYKESCRLDIRLSSSPQDWVLKESVMARAFPQKLKQKQPVLRNFELAGDINEISDSFGNESKRKAFLNSGISIGRKVYDFHTEPILPGKLTTLGEILEKEPVHCDFYIPEEEIPKWKSYKEARKFNRVTKDGHEYEYSEGAISFPDSLFKPARTIITGEGGKGANRSKHVIEVDGLLRRLTPVELERLNGFPDDHTCLPDISDSRRAYLMGNALVTGVIEAIGIFLVKELSSVANTSRLVA